MHSLSRFHHARPKPCRGSARILLAVAGLAALVACGGDDPSGPGPTAEVVDHLVVEAPGTITPGQPFELRVVAVGSAGTRPFPGFDGEVGLGVSDGTVTPSTLTMSAGEGTVVATIQTTAPGIELSVENASASGSIEIRCATEASVTVTSGRFYLSAVATAQAVDTDQFVRNEEEASMPATLDFSQALEANAEVSQLTAQEVLVTASSASESNLVVQSRSLGSTALVGMSILGGGSGVATWDGGTIRGGGATGLTGFVQFTFTVEGDTVLATCEGTFEETSFSLQKVGGIRRLDTFNLGTVRLEPGEYHFRANLFNGTTTAVGVRTRTEFSCSLELSLSFHEDAPLE